VTPEESGVRYVSLTEVKNLLKKVEKERKEMIYEQRIALEHATKFARLSVKKTKELINELMKLGFLEEAHAYKIADLLPKNDEEVKTLFAKERKTLSNENITQIVEMVGKYSIE